MNNENHDIYVSFSSKLKSSHAGETLTGFFFGEESLIGVNSDGSLANGTIERYSHLSNTNFSASKGKTFSLITMSESILANTTIDLIIGTESFYHEMKAHVDGSVQNMTAEHDAYGSTYSVKLWGPKMVNAEDPAGRFLLQLLQIFGENLRDFEKDKFYGKIK